MHRVVCCLVRIETLLYKWQKNCKKLDRCFGFIPVVVVAFAVNMSKGFSKIQGLRCPVKALKSFFTTALDRDDWLASRPGRFTTGKITTVIL